MTETNLKPCHPIEDAKDEEIKRIQKALEEIKKMVKHEQDAVYIFPAGLDNKDGVYVLEVLEEALEGRENESNNRI